MHNLKCNTRFIGKQYIWLDQVDSTNSMLKRLINDNTTLEPQVGFGTLIEGTPEPGMIVIADYQEAGRGRSGHNWISPKGTSLAISVLLRPEVSDESKSMITLIAALAVWDAVFKTCGIEASIKWPNDIVIGKKKVCGILTELDITDGIQSLILGVGINVNQDSFPEDIADKATSLMKEAGHYIDSEEVMKNFAESLEHYYDIFVESGDMSVLLEEYNSKLINRDAEVKVLDPSEDITGLALGIDNEGKLIVRTDDGVEHHIYAGEVSVRGLYGYV